MNILQHDINECQTSINFQKIIKIFKLFDILVQTSNIFGTWCPTFLTLPAINKASLYIPCSLIGQQSPNINTIIHPKPLTIYLQLDVQFVHHSFSLCTTSPTASYKNPKTHDDECKTDPELINPFTRRTNLHNNPCFLKRSLEGEKRVVVTTIKNSDREG